MDERRAVEAIERGEIVGVPTDTVYGLAVHPRLPGAVRRLFELKGRPVGRPIGLLASAIDDFARLADINRAAARLAARHWPGPLTLVVSSTAPLPDWVGDHQRNTIAVRVPDLEIVRRLFAATGPLAVTSANRSGEQAALSDREARECFGDAVAYYVPGTCAGGEPSTVVDTTVDPPEVLRKGPIAIRR